MKITIKLDDFEHTDTVSQEDIDRMGLTEAVDIVSESAIWKYTRKQEGYTD